MIVLWVVSRWIGICPYEGSERLTLPMSFAYVNQSLTIVVSVSSPWTPAISFLNSLSVPEFWSPRNQIFFFLFMSVGTVINILKDASLVLMLDSSVITYIPSNTISCADYLHFIDTNPSSISFQLLIHFKIFSWTTIETPLFVLSLLLISL